MVGVSPDAIRIDAGGPEPTEVALPAVYAARRDPGPDADPIERAGVALAYWSGGFDLAVSAALATDDTLALGGDLGLLRQRGGSRLRLESGYRLAAQKLDGEPGETTQNEVRGLVRQELDLTPRLFAFGSADAEYDEIEELTIRTVPKLGLGTVLFESESLRLAVDGGGAYVYQRFFGGESERYPAAAFGAESDLKLPVAGASWRTRLDYTPSLTHWTDDWLLRAETSLLVPLASSLSFKASLLDLYNASPAEGTDENSLSTLLGLSVGF